jgi:hypothetical protein
VSDLWFVVKSDKKSFNVFLIAGSIINEFIRCNFQLGNIERDFLLELR